MCSKQATRPSINKSPNPGERERWLHSWHRTFTTFQCELNSMHTHTPSCLTKVMSCGQKYVTSITGNGLKSRWEASDCCALVHIPPFPGTRALLGPLMRPLQPCPAGVCVVGGGSKEALQPHQQREGTAGPKDLGSAPNH